MTFWRAICWFPGSVNWVGTDCYARQDVFSLGRRGAELTAGTAVPNKHLSQGWTDIISVIGLSAYRHLFDNIGYRLSAVLQYRLISVIGYRQSSNIGLSVIGTILSTDIPIFCFFPFLIIFLNFCMIRQKICLHIQISEHYDWEHKHC